MAASDLEAFSIGRSNPPREVGRRPLTRRLAAARVSRRRLEAWTSQLMVNQAGVMGWGTHDNLKRSPAGYPRRATQRSAGTALNRRRASDRTQTRSRK